MTRLLLVLAVFILPISAHAESKIPPHASGLVLAEVTSVTKKDYTASDGDFVEIVQVRIEKSTGCTFTKFSLPIAFGGLRPPGSPPPVWNGPPPGTFKEGEKYWIAISSIPTTSSPCFPEIIGWWRETDGSRADFEMAVKYDLLHKRPHYSEEAGITINYYTEGSEKLFVEAIKDKKLLWKKEFKNSPANYLPFLLGHLSGGLQADELTVTGLKDDSWVEHVSIMEDVTADNPYHIPFGKYPIRRVYDIASGNLIAEIIQDKYTGIYNANSGKLAMTTHYVWNPNLPTPENSSTPDRKGNLEKVIKKYNPQTGDFLSEARFYYALVKSNPGISQSQWIQE